MRQTLKNLIPPGAAHGKPGAVSDSLRKKLQIIWGGVLGLTICVIITLAVSYNKFETSEKNGLIQQTRLVNEAFVEQTLQIVNQVDTILHAVSGFYQQTGSLDKTESFISTLGFNRTIIDNIYLINADGRIEISHIPEAKGRTVTDRDYFSIHRDNPSDQLHISSVEPGRVTGKSHFRITRRLTRQDGGFGGIILATINPEGFTRYYRNLAANTDQMASLVGTEDHRLRARMPAPPENNWSQQLTDSPLWRLLRQSPVGQYENTSKIDKIQRYFVYQKVGSFPLVMVSGFSLNDLRQTIFERMLWLASAALVGLLLAVMSALLFSIEIKRRTEQDQTTYLLRHSEARLHEAQRIGKIGHWELDIETGIIEFSDILLEMNPINEMPPPYLLNALLHRYHPDDLPRLQHGMQEVLANRKPQHIDVRLLQADGGYKWFRHVARPVVDSQGVVSRLVGTTQDIDHDKQMEQKLKELNENLLQRIEEETNKRIVNEGLLTQNAKMAAMGEMIGAIAHQWRQPLATVGVIFQNLLAARKMNKLDEAYLEKAANDATALISHMSRTIDSFRNFFKPEKKKELFNIIKKIEDATGFIRAQLVNHNIHITLPECHGAACVINGFPNEFAQVILNLLANARDAILDKRNQGATGAEAITVTAQSDGTQIIIEVSDTGCGIPPEHADRLFEPYFTTKKEGSGTGIGLYMSRQIIEESMGGKLTFTSKPGETVFRIELPHA